MDYGQKYLTIIGILLLCAVHCRFEDPPSIEDIKTAISDLESKVKGDSEEVLQVKSQLNELKTFVGKESKSNAKAETYKNIGASVKSLTLSIPKIQSGDVTLAIIGFLDIISGFAGLRQSLVGTSVLFGIFSSVFAFLTGQEVSKTVDTMIAEALKEDNDEELRREAFGTQKMFKISKAFLDGVRKDKRPLTESEVSSLSANFPIYKGVKFMAILGKYISENNPKSDAEATRAVKLIEAYCKLCGTRMILLSDLLSVISAAEHSPHIAEGIQQVILESREEFKVPLKDIMTGAEKEKYGILMALYPKQQNPLIFSFFKAVNIPDIPRFQDDYSGSYTFRNWHYSKYYLKQLESSYMGVMSCVVGSKKTPGTVVLKKNKTTGYYKVKFNSDYWGYKGKNDIKFSCGKEDNLKTRDDEDLAFYLLPVQDGNDKFFLLKFRQQSFKYLYLSASSDIKETAYKTSTTKVRWIVAKSNGTVL